MQEEIQPKKLNSITDATQKDWDDFWNDPEFDKIEFERIWNEMEKIEPLTPIADED